MKYQQCSTYPSLSTLLAILSRILSNSNTSSECHITRGLEAIRKTRFGTIILAAWALQCNIPAIKRVDKHGKFDLGVGKALFSFIPGPKLTAFKGIGNFLSPGFSFYNDLELELALLIKLGTPALKALTCLEANKATVGDVYIFWHAMIWATREVLEDRRSEFPDSVKEKVIGILNSWHNQIFGNGNLSTSKDLYLLGAYLNPSM